MGQSLQEQLLKAGLVSKGKASKAKKEQHKKIRQQRSGKKNTINEEDKQRLQAQADKVEKDRALNRQRNEARSQREIAAQIKQLVQQNRHPKGGEEDDVAFYFDNKGKVKKLYVSAETHQMITDGKLIIVNCNGEFELVPPATAEKIRQRNPAFVIDLPKEQNIDDAYAEHQIPDDLKW